MTKDDKSLLEKLLEKDQALLQKDVTMPGITKAESEDSLPIAYDNTKAKNIIEKLIADGYGTSQSSPYREKLFK